MKRRRRAIITIAAIVVCASVLATSQVVGASSRASWAKLTLENKDPSTWEVIDDSMYGVLFYKKVAPAFDYSLVARGLSPETDYSLIYYADESDPFINWGGNNPGALIATGTTDHEGKMFMDGSTKLNMDLPHVDDFNYPDGAKIWLVPSSDYDETAFKLTVWNPETYLFEYELITYHEALDYVDIGDPSSEAGHHLKGWGPIEPDTSGGGYGGIDDCRVTWEPGAMDTTSDRSASFMMKVPSGFMANMLVLKVLHGLADDSFEVYVRGKMVHSYIVTDQQTGNEDWITHTITLDSDRRGRLRVLIRATGEQWSGFDTYGQLAVDYAKLLE